MSWMVRTTGFFMALMLGACVVGPPTGPNVMALPPQGKDLAQFQQEDLSCRQYADNQIGVAPADAANQSLATSATVGTVLGAAAGAAIGAATGNPAAGAAIGAGSGLFLGGAAGIDAAGYSASSLQQRYDTSYAQCMASSGNITPVATGGGSAPWYYGYPYYGYPYSYAYGYPYAYPWYWGAPVGVGASFLFVSGHGHHHHHDHDGGHFAGHGGGHAGMHGGMGHR